MAKTSLEGVQSFIETSVSTIGQTVTNFINSKIDDIVEILTDDDLTPSQKTMRLNKLQADEQPIKLASDWVSTVLSAINGGADKLIQKLISPVTDKIFGYIGGSVGKVMDVVTEWKAKFDSVQTNLDITNQSSILYQYIQTSLNCVTRYEDLS